MSSNHLPLDGPPALADWQNKEKESDTHWHTGIMECHADFCGQTRCMSYGGIGRLDGTACMKRSEPGPRISTNLAWKKRRPTNSFSAPDLRFEFTTSAQGCHFRLLFATCAGRGPRHVLSMTVANQISRRAVSTVPKVQYIWNSTVELEILENVSEHAHQSNYMLFPRGVQ